MEAFISDEESDTRNSVRFVSIKEDHEYFVFEPPYQKNASKLTESAVTAWGVQMIKRPSIKLSPCNKSNHGDHEYLLPFHSTNTELLTLYEDRDEDTFCEGNDVSRDYAKLKEIRDNYGIYVNTKFHCSGHPLRFESYKELDWTTRLYYCLKDKLPDNITVHDSYRYRSDFRPLQEFYSSCSRSTFYSLCAVPDLIFTKKTSRASTASNPMYVDVSEGDETELIEIKNGGPLPCSRTNDLPHAYAQVFGGLHFLATARVINRLRSNKMLDEVNCKGLLINRKDKLILFTLKVKIGQLCNSELPLEYSKLDVHNPVVSLAHVCAGIQELVL